MTSEEKVYRATELIQDLCFEDVKITADEMYQMMVNERLIDIAELIAEFTTFIYDLRDILEGEERHETCN